MIDRAEFPVSVVYPRLTGEFISGQYLRIAELTKYLVDEVPIVVPGSFLGLLRGHSAESVRYQPLKAIC